MYDRSALPPAHFEFVVLADTHYMIDPAGKQVEFTSRRRQTARTAYALQQVAALTAHEAEPLIIHMGDIMQEFPEQPDFAQARAEALAQMNTYGIKPRFVAGNHDVGDKPDPTMPASWVTPEFLADYHAHFGRSWYSWEQAGLHFVVLNSQIMNSALPEAAEQEAWLEADLAAHAGERIFLFLHLPPFLCAPNEPDLGHYDNLGEPARSWLLNLVQRYQVELLFAAHVHWAYFNQIGPTRYYTTPSVAFTRPGFSELFSSPPPAEQGRDDVEKLGFYLVRVYEKGTSVHFIRTGGRTISAETDRSKRVRLITATSTTQAAGGLLGVVARHPLAPVGQVPSAWPSTIRQPVRNDYGLLSLVELGAHHLRVPATDLIDPLQRERLALLRSQGVRITGQWLYDPRHSLTAQVQPHLAQVDAVEVSLLGMLWPDDAAITQLRELEEISEQTIMFSCVVPGNKVPGKQHGRSQIGYLPEQLAELDQRLHAANLTVNCAVRLSGSVAEIISAVQRMPSRNASDEGAPAFAALQQIDWIFTIPTMPHADRSVSAANDERISDIAQLNALATALFCMLLRSNESLSVEPFVDLDRTMDSGPGLLDRAYNPHSSYHLVRHLQTIFRYLLGGSSDRVSSRSLQHRSDEKYHYLQIEDHRFRCALVLPRINADQPTSPIAIDSSYMHQLGLVSGTLWPGREPAATPIPCTIVEPTLLYTRQNTFGGEKEREQRSLD